MHVFGSHWEGHFFRIAEDWRARVQPEDIVLIPGDISWAMKLEDALADLQAIGGLPGRKVILRGNHDYWWGSIGKLRSLLPAGMYALQNDALSLDGLLFCGSRGWVHAVEDGLDEDRKIYARELGRMELSLQHARRLDANAVPIVLTHYPPVEERGGMTPMAELLIRYGVEDVVYGHLHGAACERAFAGVVGGMRCHPVSCDCLGFRLYELPF